MDFFPAALEINNGNRKKSCPKKRLGFSIFSEPVEINNGNRGKKKWKSPKINENSIVFDFFWGKTGNQEYSF